MKPAMPFPQTVASGAARVLPSLLLLALLVAGCKSTDTPKSSRLASVIIRGHSQVQVAQMTQRVFLEQGYERSTVVKSADMVFEKQGTSMNTLVYGDWSGKAVWVRVKVYLRELGAPDVIMLDCNAYMVQEHNEPLFEEEHKLTAIRKGTYQKLLDEVSKRLQQPTSARSGHRPNG